MGRWCKGARGSWPESQFATFISPSVTPHRHTRMTASISHIPSLEEEWSYLELLRLVARKTLERKASQTSEQVF